MWRIKFLLGLLGLVLGMGQARAFDFTPAFEALATKCAPEVEPHTLHSLVSVESSGNPFAIGVVNGALDQQPKSKFQAIEKAKNLLRQGKNFSMGLSQVNIHNLAKYGQTIESIFDPCENLATGGKILTDCFERAGNQFSEQQMALRAALSCYYSGNFSRGFRPDHPGDPSYVEKVVQVATQQPIVPRIKPNQTSSADQTIIQSERPPKANESKSDWVIFTQSIPASDSERPKTNQVPVKVQEVNKSNNTPGFVQIMEN